MTTRAEAEGALRAGLNAELGAANPYAGKSRGLAQLWMRGYMDMLTVTSNMLPSRQRYLAARATAEQSSNWTNAPLSPALQVCSASVADYSGTST